MKKKKNKSFLSSLLAPTTKEITVTAAAENFVIDAPEEKTAPFSEDLSRSQNSSGEISKIKLPDENIYTLVGRNPESLVIADSGKSYNGSAEVTITAADLGAITPGEIELADIAESGNVNDLIQTSGDELVLYCGTSTEII